MIKCPTTSASGGQRDVSPRKNQCGHFGREETLAESLSGSKKRGRGRTLMPWETLQLYKLGRGKRVKICGTHVHGGNGQFAAATRPFFTTTPPSVFNSGFLVVVLRQQPWIAASAPFSGYRHPTSAPSITRGDQNPLLSP
jgi:hypothetical protein